jgi:hypothetical protein
MSAPVTAILLVQAALHRNKMRGGGPAVPENSDQSL